MSPPNSSKRNHERFSNGPLPTQEQNDDVLSQDKKSVLSPKSVAAPY